MTATLLFSLIILLVPDSHAAKHRESGEDIISPVIFLVQL